MGVNPVIWSGNVTIQNDPDTQYADPGTLTVSQTGSFGTFLTVGTYLTVGTTLTTLGLVTAPALSLTSTTTTNTIAGPVNLQNPFTSSSTGSFLTLTTTSTTAANTFNGPSTFVSTLTGNTGSFSSSLSASFFTGTSSTLTNTINGPLSLTNTLNSTNAATFAGALNITLTNDTTSLVTLGGATITKSLTLGGELKLGTNASSITTSSNPISSNAGVLITANPVTWTDTSTAASATAAGNFYSTYLGISTLTATNTNVTTPLAATLYVAGAPIASTNQTLSSTYSAYFATGTVYIGSTTASATASTGALVVAGGTGIGGNAVVGGILAATSIQDFGTLSVLGVTSLASSLVWTQIAQPAAPAATTNTTFFVNSTSGLLQSINSASAVTTYQPLTTIGDLGVFNGTTQTRLPVAADGNTLLCDSTTAVGVSWQANTRNLVLIGNTATVYAPKFLTKYYTGTTANGNGQVLVYPNINNTSGGSRIFSTINFVSVYVQGNTGGTNAWQSLQGLVWSQTITVIDARIITGTNTLLLSTTPNWAPNGISAVIKVEGVPL